MTLQELLAQALGMGSDEPVRLADGPPSYRTRGNLPVAPIAQRMASLPARQPPRFQNVPRPDDYPFPFYDPRQVAPQVPRTALQAFPDFADYVNSELGLQTRPASGMAGPPPDYVNPLGGPTSPASNVPATAMPQPVDEHGEALMGALRRARATPTPPLISPEERARAIEEERRMLQAGALGRRGLFGGSGPR